MFVLDIFNYKKTTKSLKYKTLKVSEHFSDFKFKIEAKVWFKKYKEVVIVFAFYIYEVFF